jgi:hypothetical protein
MESRRLDRSDIAIVVALAMGLALPFLPLIGNARAHMQVRFHAPGMATERSFSASATLTDCEIMANALEYEHSDTGNFVRISCEQ